MIKLVIDRSKWLRGGKDSKTSCMRNKAGEMCCLGFAAQALGVTDEDLEGCLAPNSSGLFRNHDKLNRFFIDYFSPSDPRCNDVTSRAVTINDDRHIDDVVREEMLIPRLAKLGFDVIFVDGDK